MNQIHMDLSKILRSWLFFLCSSALRFVHENQKSVKFGDFPATFAPEPTDFLMKNQKSGRILVRLGAFGCVWVRLGVFGCVRVRLGASRCVWVRLGAFGCVWVRLGAFGCVWVRLGAFGCVWARLGAFSK